MPFWARTTTKARTRSSATGSPNWQLAGPTGRERFLHNCSGHGALLALSLAGGHGGERELPLLKHDTDWDALTDRLYTLVPELEPAELLGRMVALP